MISMGASAVFAVDVGAVSGCLTGSKPHLSPHKVDDTTPRNFGDSVSGWWLFINRLNPFTRVPGVPPITEIQSRLA